MKIKVVEVISDTNIGGAGRLLLTRLSVCNKDIFDEEVILPQSSELEAEFNKIGIPVKRMKYCKDRSFDIREIYSLYRSFRQISPDIVNTHGCLSARIAASLARVPIRIYTRHCAFEPKRIMTVNPAKKINSIFADALSTKIIAVADAAKDNLIDTGINSGNIEVIINGVNKIQKYTPEEKSKVKREYNIPEKAFVCGICARLEDCKGIDIFLRAARKLLRENKNYYFLIVGKGSLEIKLRELAKSLGISEYVRFCGFVSDITPYINCFDLNINCSRGTETSSLALSEGMSIGLPCIASDWGGNPYMVKNGYNGFIYKTDNFIELAETINKLYVDKALYNKMSENALRRYEDELNAENMTRKTEALYYKLFLENNQSKTADAMVK